MDNTGQSLDYVTHLIISRQCNDERVIEVVQKGRFFDLFEQPLLMNDRTKKGSELLNK
jgi:hypothetical protein